MCVGRYLLNYISVADVTSIRRLEEAQDYLYIDEPLVMENFSYGRGSNTVDVKGLRALHVVCESASAGAATADMIDALREIGFTHADALREDDRTALHCLCASQNCTLQASVPYFPQPCA